MATNTSGLGGGTLANTLAQQALYSGQPIPPYLAAQMDPAYQGRLALAQNLMQQGTSTEPTRSPLGILSRLASVIVGQRLMNRATGGGVQSQAGGTNRDATRAAFVSLLGGPNTPQAQAYLSLGDYGQQSFEMTHGQDLMEAQAAQAQKWTEATQLQNDIARADAAGDTRLGNILRAKQAQLGITPSGYVTDIGPDGQPTGHYVPGLESDPSVKATAAGAVESATQHANLATHPHIIQTPDGPQPFDFTDAQWEQWQQQHAQSGGQTSAQGGGSTGAQGGMGNTGTQGSTKTASQNLYGSTDVDNPASSTEYGTYSAQGGEPSIASAIAKQESGANPNVRPSVQGAIGQFQIMPATFAQYARPGENINDPVDNARVGHRIIAELSQKAGGDPARVAVGYFSGPGNIARPGSPTPWIHDVKDGNGTSVSQYVAQITSRMGGDVDNPASDKEYTTYSAQGPTGATGGVPAGGPAVPTLTSVGTPQLDPTTQVPVPRGGGRDQRPLAMIAPQIAAALSAAPAAPATVPEAPSDVTATVPPIAPTTATTLGPSPAAPAPPPAAPAPPQPMPPPPLPMLRPTNQNVSVNFTQTPEEVVAANAAPGVPMGVSHPGPNPLGVYPPPMLRPDQPPIPLPMLRPTPPDGRPPVGVGTLARAAAGLQPGPAPTGLAAANTPFFNWQGPPQTEETRGAQPGSNFSGLGSPAQVAAAPDQGLVGDERSLQAVGQNFAPEATPVGVAAPNAAVAAPGTVEAGITPDNLPGTGPGGTATPVTAPTPTVTAPPVTTAAPALQPAVTPPPATPPQTAAATPVATGQTGAQAATGEPGQPALTPTPVPTAQIAAAAPVQTELEKQLGIPAGSTPRGPLAQDPSNQALITEDYKRVSANAANVPALQQQQETAGIIRDIAQDLATGQLAPMKADAARFLKAFNAPDDIVNSILNTNATSVDELEKLLLQQTSQAVKQLGDKAGYVLQMFKSAYPSLQSQPGALQMVENMIDMDAQRQIDQSIEEGKWFDAAKTKPGREGGSYHGFQRNPYDGSEQTFQEYFDKKFPKAVYFTVGQARAAAVPGVTPDSEIARKTVASWAHLDEEGKKAAIRLAQRKFPRGTQFLAWDGLPAPVP